MTEDPFIPTLLRRSSAEGWSGPRPLLAPCGPWRTPAAPLTCVAGATGLPTTGVNLSCAGVPRGTRSGQVTLGLAESDRSSTLKQVPAAVDEPRRRLTVVSLFSGIGALDLGLERAGHQVVEMCESWGPARRVLAHRFPAVPVHEDVRDYLPKNDYDVLAAGFPCTDVSHAGRRAGIFGQNSGLVEHVFRIASKTSPQWILLENVPNLLGLHSGAGMEYVIGQLEVLGYKWAYRTLDSRFTGVPQRRSRVIFVASRTENPAPVLLQDDAGPPLARPEPTTASGFYWTEGRTGLGLVPGALPTLKGGSTLGLPSAPAVWFPGRASGRRFVLPGTEDGEALQGLPRGWTTAAVVADEPNLRWKLIGNAVTVGVGSWLGDQLAGPDPDDWIKTVAQTATPILSGRKWPAAGWGCSGTRLSSQASPWPYHAEMVDLEEIVVNSAPLSFRAASGFLSRVEEAGRIIPSDMRRDLEDHIRVTRPVPPRESWASSDSSLERMKSQRQKNTKPELALRRLLHRRGRRYRLQVRPSPEMRQRIDIAFMKEKVAIDVRGCFWHRCPVHGTAPKANAERWSDKLRRNVDRDLQTKRLLEELGWEVVIVWEHENPESAAARVDAVLLARRGGAPGTETPSRASRIV